MKGFSLHTEYPSDTTPRSGTVLNNTDSDQEFNTDSPAADPPPFTVAVVAGIAAGVAALTVILTLLVTLIVVAVLRRQTRSRIHRGVQYNTQGQTEVKTSENYAYGVFDMRNPGPLGVFSTTAAEPNVAYGALQPRTDYEEIQQSPVYEEPQSPSLTVV